MPSVTYCYEQTSRSTLTVVFATPILRHCNWAQGQDKISIKSKEQTSEIHNQQVDEVRCHVTRVYHLTTAQPDIPPNSARTSYKRWDATNSPTYHNLLNTAINASLSEITSTMMQSRKCTGPFWPIPPPDANQTIIAGTKLLQRTQFKR